eukprot:767476-Hanusia_phi.AAC.1
MAAAERGGEELRKLLLLLHPPPRLRLHRQVAKSKCSKRHGELIAAGQHAEKEGEQRRIGQVLLEVSGQGEERESGKGRGGEGEEEKARKEERTWSTSTRTFGLIKRQPRARTSHFRSSSSCVFIAALAIIPPTPSHVSATSLRPPDEMQLVATRNAAACCSCLPPPPSRILSRLARSDSPTRCSLSMATLSQAAAMRLAEWMRPRGPSSSSSSSVTLRSPAAA